MTVAAADVFRKGKNSLFLVILPDRAAFAVFFYILSQPFLAITMSQLSGLNHVKAGR
jgi:hypothetical protein